MSDDLQRQLAELLKFLLAQAQDATLWAKTQIPPLVEERIRFGRAYHSVIIVACVIVAWRVSVYARGFYAEAHGDKVARAKRDEYDLREWPERPGGIAFVACILGLCALTVIGSANFHDALLAWVAPRLYIVDWLLSLTTKPS